MGSEMEPLLLAWSYFRRRKFQLCADLCTQMLEKSPYDQVPVGPHRPCGSWRRGRRLWGMPRPPGGDSGEEGPRRSWLCGQHRPLGRDPWSRGRRGLSAACPTPGGTHDCCAMSAPPQTLAAPLLQVSLEGTLKARTFHLHLHGRILSSLHVRGSFLKQLYINLKISNCPPPVEIAAFFSFGASV